VRERGEALDHARRQVEKCVSERSVRRVRSESAEDARGQATKRRPALERCEGCASALPGRREGLRVANALAAFEAFERLEPVAEGGVDPDLVLTEQAVERQLSLACRTQLELGDLNAHVEPSARSLEAVEEEASLGDAFAASNTFCCHSARIVPTAGIVNANRSNALVRSD
jgi:hypothetical protein